MRIDKYCQSGWWSGDLGQPQGPITRVGWKGDKHHKTNQLWGFFPGLQNYIFQKCMIHKQNFCKKSVFDTKHHFWSILDPNLSLLKAKTPLLAPVGEIFPPISSLHSIPSQMPVWTDHFSKRDFHTVQETNNKYSNAMLEHHRWDFCAHAYLRRNKIPQYRSSTALACFLVSAVFIVNNWFSTRGC